MDFLKITESGQLLIQYESYSSRVSLALSDLKFKLGRAFILKSISGQLFAFSDLLKRYFMVLIVVVVTTHCFVHRSCGMIYAIIIVFI